MKQIIEKGCAQEDHFKMKIGYYDRARDAFGSVLDKIGITRDDKVLLPAYIGWSAREGSGVFDPVSERNIQSVFYALDGTLSIDLDDLKTKIETSGAKAILLIHYFGFVDPHCNTIIETAKAKGMTVIEDAAHAMFTDFVGRACGRSSDYKLYSLHKMLPLLNGGMLIAAQETELPNDTLSYCVYGNPFHYDFEAISQRRIVNYNLISQFLGRGNDLIKTLYNELSDGIVPQTYPVLLPKSNRDKVYQQMNQKGWGVVSLYHTMIDCIDQFEFSETHSVSRSILNLPVHQDVYPELIELMISDLNVIVEKCLYPEQNLV